MTAVVMASDAMPILRSPVSTARRHRRQRQDATLHYMSLDEARVALALLASGAVPIRIKMLEAFLGRPGHDAFADLRLRVMRSGLDLEMIKTKRGFVLIGSATALETLYVTSSLRLGHEVLARADDERAGAVFADAGGKVGTGFPHQASEENLCEPLATPIPSPSPQGGRERGGAL